MFVEKDGETKFGYTNIIIRGSNGDLYYANTEDRFETSSEIDIDNLDKTSINTDGCWPLYSPRFLQAPSTIPPDSYVKGPALSLCENHPKDTPVSDLVLHKVEAYELLRRHPHPNIVKYRGCVVSDGRITGICLAKYTMTLYERMAASTPFDKDLFLDGIERGVRHLHSLGIVHNDISPNNIMLDELDRPVIIDFDAWQNNGEELGITKGTSGWMIEGSEYALFENDFFALSKIQEFIYDPSSGKPLSGSTSSNSSQTTTSSTTSSGSTRDVSDAFDITPELPVQGDRQNTTTPPPLGAQEEAKTVQALGLGQDKGTGL
ncbi:uncharacterized protein CPUR_04545 [Claviceps purpurea 20.1]|uniref:EKC/KEOPS complex subunit BUD32 n=1 Tax=Claviceps purpurea (strain 20.1) TaxID=1111077 RepID=M1W172_CLAP2|nr:uncharacterized protein CPUR_04545 [Claviceps purpurea 20.1]